MPIVKRNHASQPPGFFTGTGDCKNRESGCYNSFRFSKIETLYHQCCFKWAEKEGPCIDYLTKG